MSASMCRLPSTVIVDAGSAARASCQAAEVTHPQIKRQRSAAATRRSMNAAPRPNRARLTHDRRGGSVSDYVGIWGIVASGRDTMVTNKGSPDALRRLCWLRFAVLQHLNLLYGYQPARHHLVEHRQKCVDLFLGIDDLHYHRQVLRQPQ